MSQSRFTRRRVWLALPLLAGLGAVALLLALAPARPAQAAPARLAPAGCVNDDLELNDTYTDATSLRLPAVVYDRWICNDLAPQDRDWYSVTLAAGQPLAAFLHFTHANGDLDLYLYAADGNLLAFSNATFDNESFAYTAASAGTYYVEVEGFSEAQNQYDLSLSGGCYARAISTFSSIDAQAVRDAVAQAPTGGTVKVAGYCPGTAPDGQSSVTISGTLTLAGGYAPSDWTTPHPLTQPTTLDAMRASRVISASGALTLTDLTVQQGFLADYGGGLYFDGGALVLNGMNFNQNHASYGAGGVWSGAGLTVLTDTIFSENATNSGYAGGLRALAVTINGGIFQNNQADDSGGGLYAANQAFITDTVFSHNRSGGNGGAAYLGAGSQVSGAFVQFNQARGGGGLHAEGPLVLLNSQLLQNIADLDDGGGVAAYASVQITATTFVSNSSATSGGGLAQLENVQLAPAQAATPPAASRLVNLLFAGNSAAQAADIYLNNPQADTVLHSTFVAGNNPAEAIRVATGSLTLRDSLLSGYPLAVHRATGSASEDYDLFYGGGGAVAGYLSGTVTSGGHSRVGNPLFQNAPAGDYHLTFPSPARDAGLNLGVATDFDGEARPSGLGVDIGFDELPYSRLFLPLVRR